MFECRLLILNAHSVRCAHAADSLARLRCAPPSADLTPGPFPKGKGSEVKESRSGFTALSHFAYSIARFASDSAGGYPAENRGFDEIEQPLQIHPIDRHHRRAAIRGR